MFAVAFQLDILKFRVLLWFQRHAYFLLLEDGEERIVT